MFFRCFFMILATFKWILARMTNKRHCLTGSFPVRLQRKILFFRRKSTETTSKWLEIISKSVRKLENRFWVFFFIFLLIFSWFFMIFHRFSSFFIVCWTPKVMFFYCFASFFIIKSQFLERFSLRIDLFWSQVHFP